MNLPHGLFLWFLSGFLAYKAFFVGLVSLWAGFEVTKVFPWSLQVGFGLFFYKHPACVMFFYELCLMFSVQHVWWFFGMCSLFWQGFQCGFGVFLGVVLVPRAWL